MSEAFARRYGPFALVTGASSGIGAEFARQLAAKGLSLILCARRKERLDALGRELGERHGIDVLALQTDLSRHDFMPRLLEEIGDRDVGLLVNNAGFGDKGPFLESDLAMQLRMLDTNCRAPMILAHTFGRRLVARGRGGIVFTSSTAAFQGLPFSSHYAATKGYDLQLAEGLWYELGRSGIDVLALCPGPTDTEGPKRTGVDPKKVPIKPMDVAPVVSDALAALGKAPSVIPGLANRAAYWAVKMLPRSVTTRLAGRIVLRVTGN